jgi:hypothetical protein
MFINNQFIYLLYFINYKIYDLLLVYIYILKFLVYYFYYYFLIVIVFIYNKF